MNQNTKKNITILIFSFILISIILFLSIKYINKTKTLPVSQVKTHNQQQFKKILYIDSYFSDYEWSRNITNGIIRILNIEHVDPSNYKSSDSSLHLKIFRMDTKRNPAEDYIKNIALKTKDLIDEWKPDVVIASDDNASKYVIAPYYKSSDIPVVFCGLNWDASIYGFPTENITGMVEIDFFDKLIAKLKEYSKGNRIGIIHSNVLSNRRQLEYYKNKFGVKFSKEIIVTNFSDWKEEFIKIQKDVDFLIFLNNAGIKDWDPIEAQQLAETKTIIPTGTLFEWMSPYCLINYSTSGAEQGEWAAFTALDILRGIKPSEIPVAFNKKIVEVFLNHQIAKKINIKFKKDLLYLEKQNFARGPYSWEKISEKNYKGITLNILTHEVPVMGEPTVLHARQFEEMTGAKVNITHIPFGKLYQEALLGVKNNRYDIIIYGSLWIADMFEYLEPLPDKMLKSSQFIDILPHYKNIAKWDETTYQVNIDGDRHYFQYRKDLLENKKFKKDYLAQHGQELRVPKTWKEVNKIAAFFHGKKINQNEKIYGISEITNKDDLLFSQFIKRAAPYAKHPDIIDGFYFELETMRPMINTPGFVEALRDFVESTKYYPPGGDKFGLADVIHSFGNGESVFSDCWDDSFVKAMEKESGISNKVRASLSPGSKKVWNRKTKQWDDFPEINYAPYFAWGWTSGVNKKCENKNAAFDFLGFFSNYENHFADMQVGKFGVNPFRKSDLNPVFWTERTGWEKPVAESYVKTLQEMNLSPNKIMDLRIHKSRQYMNALSIGVFRALTGRDDPQSALDEVAIRWDEITENVGRDKQRKAYRNIVKFENAIYNEQE